jgi:hypothetical protein
MIEKAHTTKDIGGARTKEFHFSGSTKYIPMTITAATREEAENIWLEKRELVDKPTKVEDKAAEE